METEVQQEAVTQESQAAASPALSDTQSAGSVESTSAVQAKESGEGSEAPAYSPNLKFKFTDSAKDETYEREFDEWIRPVIKDPETEKKIRELYEKAYGLDYVKPKLQATREKYQSVQNEYNELQQGLSELSTYVQRGDLDSFFGALKIPQDKIFQYVLDKLNYQQLSPDQKAAYDQQRQLQSQSYLQERRLAEMEGALQQQAVQARTYELDQALSSPQVRSISESFDARVGRPGAFRQEVVRRGQLAYYNTGADIPVTQALNEALETVGRLVQDQGQAVQNQTNVASGQAKAPVIPNVGSGKNVSAVAKQVKSLSDIESIYQEKYGR